MSTRNLPCDTHLPHCTPAGKALRQLRRAKGLSQADLALLTRLSRTTITRMERLGPSRYISQETYDRAIALLNSLIAKPSTAAEDLKRLRRRCGLTQAELADLSGISQPTISRLEHDSEAAPATRQQLVTLLLSHQDRQPK